MHRIGTKVRFIPEQYLGATAFRLYGDGGEGCSLPKCHRLRFSLVGSLQRFLCRQAQSGQQCPDGRQRELDSKAREQQLLHNLAHPQTKVKTVLIGAFSIDPAKDLTLLGRGEFSGAPGCSPSLILCTVRIRISSGQAMPMTLWVWMLKRHWGCCKQYSMAFFVFFLPSNPSMGCRKKC